MFTNKQIRTLVIEGLTNELISEKAIQAARLKATNLLRYKTNAQIRKMAVAKIEGRSLFKDALEATDE